MEKKRADKERLELERQALAEKREEAELRQKLARKAKAKAAARK